VNKSELVSAIREERAELEAALAVLSPEQMVRIEAEGAWSVKDTLAHIVAWEQWMIGWTTQILSGEEPHDPPPAESDDDVDRMNAENFEGNRDQALDDVLVDFGRSYSEALKLTESLSEEALQEEHPNTWPHGPLWQGVAANTCWHYREHLDAMRAPAQE
jgi:hypothetical protein